MSNNDSKRHGIYVWVGGVVSGIILAVVTAWLSSAYSPFHEQPKFDVKILNFPSFLSMQMDKPIQIPITVYNEGNVVAEQCDIRQVDFHVPPENNLVDFIHNKRIARYFKALECSKPEPS